MPRIVKAGEIHWPSGCLTIPEGCFKDNTFVEHVSGIEGVTKIERMAFEGTWIKSFDWPKGCYEIPDRCFMNGYLENISGIESVRSIGILAFANTSLKHLDMSSMAFCHIKNEAFSRCGDLIIKFPYFMTAEQIAAAKNETLLF